MRRAALHTALTLLVCVPAAQAAPVSTMRADGSVVVREDPMLPPPDARAGAPAPTASPRRAFLARRTVRGELRALLAGGQIDAGRHDRWRRAYDDARALLPRLRGQRRVELAAVVGTLEALTRRRLLTAGRAPLLFTTLERNRRWWQSGPLLPFGRRVTFQGSRLVWQAYPGQGIQVQWLGSFGKANALWSTKEHDVELGELLDEALTLATPRDGGLGFEYPFTFAGGRPPFISSISQGTGAQALSRAAVRLGRPPYFEAARAATVAWSLAPPSGLRAGDHLLMYSSLPRLRVLNGFVQALNGIFDFAKLANDDPARALFTAGEAQLRRELRSYDTGAWSLYRPGKEADLGYHVLQRDFLRGLCGRLTDIPLADPAPYCAAAERFTGYLRTRPVVTVEPGQRLSEGRRGAIAIRLDKVSTVTLVARRGGEVVLRRTARLQRGRRTFPLVPARARPLRVSVTAVDLAGNRTTAAGVVEVARRRG